ncbi:MAG TPA: DNA polymerase I [Polyangiaceae bacterium]
MATELYPAGAPDVLYIVDISSYVLRAYHALVPLSSPSGEPTHAVLGTVNMLELLVRERRPQLFAIAMDAGRDTFRRDIFAEYKAHRPPSPPDLSSQMARCEAIVRAFCTATYKVSGVEADDIIATLVKKAREHGLRTVIVAADKDLMQLVGDDVVLWDTMRNRVIGPREVEERFGVPVAKLGDLLALMGDTSDNIPGVPHVGPKTAKDLLVEFGSLDGIYANLESLKKKAVRENLAAHKADAFLSRRLVELKSDCTLELELERLRWTGRDIPTLRALYTELGFTRQLTQLDAEERATSGPAPAAATAIAPALGASPEPSPASAAALASPGEYTTLTDAAELERLVESAARRGRLSLAAAIEPDVAMRGALIGLGLAIEPGHGVYVPFAHRYVGMPQQIPTAQALAILAPALADPNVKKTGLDLKRLGVLLARHDVRLEGFSFDAGIASYLLDPEARHDREALSERELGVRQKTIEELTGRGRGKKVGFDQLECAEAASFVGASADIALRLAEHLAPRLAEAGLERLFESVEMPLARMLVDLELAGVRVDTSVLQALGDDAEREIARLEREAHRAAGHEFNVNSPRQLETILFDELGMKPLRRTKTSRSTDAETLEALAEEHELPRIVLDIRSISKLKGTYIDALPTLVHPSTGRIHTSWEQTVAATGRLSSSDPNLQNIPIRTELGRKIRAAFVPPPGHVLISADYSQIELRVLAHLSGDPVLVEGFKTAEDVHQRTAMEIFDLTADRVEREHRTRAKAVNFGIIYGQGEGGLAKVLGIPRAEAARFIAAYYQRYQGVRRFMNETLEHARAGESVRSLLGRRRLLPAIRSGNRAERLAAERIAMNMPIQGSAADILKLAMLALRAPVTPGSRMILTVHDELVFEVPEAEADEAKAAIQHAMQSAYELAVPLTVDAGAGPNWNAAH